MAVDDDALARARAALSSPTAGPATTDVADSPKPSDVAKAVAFGLRSTQARPQTMAEITAKLHGRFDDGGVVEAAVAQLVAAGALDDAAFARLWVEDRGEQRGYGTARLRRELARRQVPDHLAEEALSALDDRDHAQTARDLARKRAATLPAKLEPPAVARRLHAYLVRRGYSEAMANVIAIEVSGLERFHTWD
jgi:regulatory protein